MKLTVLSTNASGAEMATGPLEPAMAISLAESFRNSHDQVHLQTDDGQKLSLAEAKAKFGAPDA